MKKVLICLAAATIALSACKKDRIESAVEILKTAEDNALMEAEYNQVYEYSDRAFNYLDINNQLKSGDSLDILPPCAELLHDSVLQVLTIDFGDDKCLCKDGLYRRGQIIVNYDTNYRETNGQISVQLKDYFVNNNAYSGTKTIINRGGGKYEYRVRNAQAYTSNGTIKWQTDAIITRTKGHGTVNNAFDDTYEVTGTSSGVNRAGKSYTAETTIPLKRIIQLGCIRNYVAGFIRVEDEDDNFLEIDYDPFRDEACDKIATVNINDDYTREITLR